MCCFISETLAEGITKFFRYAFSKRFTDVP
jgi:hypothetical protein